nr:hypothetical protein [Tanacetum cinerariifolium]
MVAILEKNEHNANFHPIVDFIEASPLRKYTRRARIAQSYALPPVADKPASPVRDVSEGEACPTDSDFIADQDRATIAKSSTLPYDTAPRVTSPAAVEGTQEVEIHKLKERVQVLEDNQGVIGARSTDDAPIKGRRIDEEEGITGRVSTDTEEIRMDEGEKLVEDFIPMGSNEEVERLKRKGFNLEQEKAKKQKTSEEAPNKEKSSEEIPEEKVKEIMQLVPIEEVYVQALQVKHPIID